MTPADFKRAAEELGRLLAQGSATTSYEALYWQEDHGKTALAALRAMAGGQEAWQWQGGSAIRQHPDKPEPVLGKDWRPVLIVELPNDD